MSEATVYYESSVDCPGCGHRRGFHGFDTNGCSYMGAGGWCQCDIAFADHPIVVDPDDDTTCRVCRRDLDVRLVHGGDCECVGPMGWHCPSEGAEHWASGDDPSSECGYCGSLPVEAV